MTLAFDINPGVEPRSLFRAAASTRHKSKGWTVGSILKTAGMVLGLALLPAPALADPPVADFKKSSIQAKSTKPDSNERTLLNKNEIKFPLEITGRDLPKKLVKVVVGEEEWWVREVDIIAPGLEVHEATSCHDGEKLVAAADTQLGATQMGLGSRCKKD